MIFKPKGLGGRGGRCIVRGLHTWSPLCPSGLRAASRGYPKSLARALLMPDVEPAVG